MTINRHNYETFFLLYIDNELSVSEKKAVDEFVDANPDLQEELVMLQQSVLKPDSIVFDDKRSLLKNEFIPTGVQEKLLLYLDNELTSAEKNELNQLIKSDPGIKKEWDILQQVKLSPLNSIVFPDKQSLYRKEGGRVIAFTWQRMAVAAVFIGLIIGSTVVYLNTRTKVGNTETVINDTKAKPGQKTEAKPASSEAITPDVLPPVKEKEIAAVVTIKKASVPAVVKPREKVNPKRLPGGDIQTIAVQKKDNNLPKPSFDNVNNYEGNKTTVANVTPEKRPPGSKEIDKTNSGDEHVNVYATTTSFIDKSDENSNRVLFMNEEKIKKTKLGGIFRQVKRVLGRTANIKPGGNNLKVANLEFAIQ